MLNGNLRRWRATELTFLMLGLSFVGVYSASKLDCKISSRIALQEFRTSVAPDPARTVNAEAARVVDGVDVSLWSEKRILSASLHVSLSTSSAMRLNAVVHAKSIDNHGPAIPGSALQIQTNSEEKKL